MLQLTDCMLITLIIVNGVVITIIVISVVVTILLIDYHVSTSHCNIDDYKTDIMFT